MVFWILGRATCSSSRAALNVAREATSEDMLLERVAWYTVAVDCAVLSSVPIATTELDACVLSVWITDVDVAVALAITFATMA